jgi:hypothetical protein
MNIEFSYPEYLANGRDRSVIRFYLPPKLGPSPQREYLDAVHLCVLWDHDRDQLVLAVLAALFLRNREALEQLVAVAEARGRVDFWCRSAEHSKDLQRALDDAANAVTWQRGRWKVNPGQVVPCRGTVVDWEKLPEKHPLHSVAKGQGLGLIVTGGAR